MASFSKTSRDRLVSCDGRLQVLFRKVVRDYDCTILEGHRGESRQKEVFTAGKSRLLWPHSRHNKFPSAAVDVSPYPIKWDDTPRLYHFGGFVMGVAKTLGIHLRWGGDWDQDLDFRDQTFNDLVHFELVEE